MTMFLHLAHTKTPVFLESKKLTLKCYKITKERFFEISRSSVIEVDAALDIAHELNYKTEKQLQPLGGYLVNTFKQLTGLIGQGR